MLILECSQGRYGRTDCRVTISLRNFVGKRIKKLTTKEISIFSNSSHYEWKAGLSDTILKGDHPRVISANFALIWFSDFREDLNVIFYQSMSNFYNQYKSVERKSSQKTQINVNLLIVM